MALPQTCLLLYAATSSASSSAFATINADHSPLPGSRPVLLNPFAALIPLHQYRTGKTLGSGTYAIVKEAIHIQTGKYYACKVINKRLMEGREHMVTHVPLGRP